MPCYDVTLTYKILTGLYLLGTLLGVVGVQHHGVTLIRPLTLS